MTTGDICRRQVQTIGKDALLCDAARKMRELHVGDLVVIEERYGKPIPVGVLTDRDIAVSIAAQEPAQLQTLLVGDVMLPRLITARSTDSVRAALKVMRMHGVRRLPIVNENGALCGIVTLDDILEILAEELGEVVLLIAREQQRERTTRTAG